MIKNPRRRRFIDAPSEDRCAADITLKDGSVAQCGRHRVTGGLCAQHAKIANRAKTAHNFKDQSNERIFE